MHLAMMGILEAVATASDSTVTQPWTYPRMTPNALALPLPISEITLRSIARRVDLVQ